MLRLPLASCYPQVEAGNKELEGVVTQQTEIRKRITILLVVVGVCVVGGTILGILFGTKVLTA